MFELYLATFNCARNLVNPEDLAPSLFDALPSPAALPDVFAISLQEISPIAYSFLGGSYLKPYYDGVTAAVQLAAKLRSHGAEQLDHIATRNLGMTALMVFAKPQFAGRIRWIQSAGAGVGVWNMGNKGAVAMRIGVSCPGTDNLLRLTFTAAHLAPMECNVEARNKDWENLVRNLVFINNESSGYSSTEEVPLLADSSSPPEDNNGLFAQGSHIFFAGDLNYRTHDKPPGPKDHLNYPQPSSDTAPEHYSNLLKKDQLTREKEANRTLHGLDEMPIDFPPTYKYYMRHSPGGKKHKRSASEPDRWQWAKHRHPSWCDRILFSPSSGLSKLEPHVYTALPVQPSSDHRPVALSLTVQDAPIMTDSDTSLKSPFPINPNWKTRQDTARVLEAIVGVLSYLSLTRTGNAMLVAVGGIAFATWWLTAWFSS